MQYFLRQQERSLLQGPALIVAVKQKMKMKEIYLTIWAFFHGDSFEFRSCLFRSDASANDISRTGVYRKALCQFFYANALVVCFQNQFSSFIVQHSSHLLCLCYTSFCSKVKVLCCIIENCYNVMVLSISLISFSVFLTSSDLQPVAPTQIATLNAIAAICFFFNCIKIFQASIP